MEENPEDCVHYRIEIQKGHAEDVRDGEVLVVLDLGGHELPDHVAETIMQLANGTRDDSEQISSNLLNTDPTFSTIAFDVTDNAQVTNHIGNESHHIDMMQRSMMDVDNRDITELEESVMNVDNKNMADIDRSMLKNACNVHSSSELDMNISELCPVPKEDQEEQKFIFSTINPGTMSAQTILEQPEGGISTVIYDKIIKEEPIEKAQNEEKMELNYSASHSIKETFSEEVKSESKLQVLCCDLCDYTTTNEIGMGRHYLSIHGKEKPYKCFQCGKEFEKELSLHIHALSHKPISMTLPKNGQLACPLCKFTGRLNQQMIDHFKKAHPPHEVFICSLCRFVCLSEERLKEHNMFSQKHKMKRAQNSVCPVCSLPCRNLKEHIAAKHQEERPFLCTKCSHRSKTEGSLKIHMLTHLESRDFVCVECNSAFKSRHRLKRHMLIHDPVKKFSCSKCDWTTNDKYDLKRHMTRIHTKKQHHICKQCNLTFDNTTDLKLHAMDKHKSTHKLYCEYCDFSCESKSDFRAHMQKHSRPNRFTCDVCGFSSPWKCHYDRHMTIHSDARPFACTICSYRCKEKDNLKKHMLVVHSDEKPFACKLCDYKCKLNSMLKNHMRVVHTEVRPFHCTYCNYTAKTNGNLKKHLWIHEQQKPFKCTYCPYECREGSKLKRHISKKHKVVPTGHIGSADTRDTIETLLAAGSQIRCVQVDIDNLSKPVLLDIGDSTIPM